MVEDAWYPPKRGVHTAGDINLRVEVLITPWRPICWGVSTTCWLNQDFFTTDGLDSRATFSQKAPPPQWGVGALLKSKFEVVFRWHAKQWNLPIYVALSFVSKRSHWRFRPSARIWKCMADSCFSGYHQAKKLLPRTSCNPNLSSRIMTRSKGKKTGVPVPNRLGKKKEAVASSNEYWRPRIWVGFE